MLRSRRRSLNFPRGVFKVNLAPADLPKESGRYDLPIALAILAASGQIPSDSLSRYEFAGELALTGELRPIRGALAMTYKSYKSGRAFVRPVDSAAEAALVSDAVIYPARSLLEVCSHLCGRTALVQMDAATQQTKISYADFGEVKGQSGPKRALEIAAAGGHSVIMSGPPGAGKSMLASRFAGILPSMTEEEALESAALQSLNGSYKLENWKRRPFRSPHHTDSELLWLAVAVFRVRVKSRWHIAVFYFWMSCPNLTARCWRFCASLWKVVRSPFHVPRARPIFQRNFSWLPR